MGKTSLSSSRLADGPKTHPRDPAEFFNGLPGDILGDLAAGNGWEGVILHGCVRDVDQLAGIRLGVLALGAHPRKSDKRGEGEAGVSVSFGGVTFTPGEFVYADNNGVIVSAEKLLV